MNDDLIERFAADYFDYNDISTRRRAVVRKDLRALGDHAGTSLDRITPDQFQSFLADELARGLMATTVERTAKGVRPWFKWAWRVGIIDADRYMRIMDVPLPRIPADAHLPRPYDRRELDRFWESLDATFPTLARRSTWDRYTKGNARWPRVWRHCMRLQIDAIVHLALHCGLRKHEIAQIEIADFHYDNEYVVVREGKGGRYREVPHTNGSRAAAAAWLEMRSLLRPSHDRPWLVLTPTASPNATIPSHPFNPMSSSGLDSLLHRVPGHGRGDEHWKMHRFRHTCGTEWLRAEMPIEKVQRLLGHRNLQQTLLYTQIVRTDVHAAAARAGEKFERAVSRRAA